MIITLNNEVLLITIRLKNFQFSCRSFAAVNVTLTNEFLSIALICSKVNVFYNEFES